MTKIAIISDIHGNRVGLEAVLDDIAQAKVDQIACLGDIALIGPEPAAVIARVRATCAIVVRGNTDDWLAAGQLPIGMATSRREQLINQVAAWNITQVGPAERDYLRTLPLDAEIALGEDGPWLHCCHAAPGDNTRGIWATTPDDEVGPLLQDIRATVIAFGHTHSSLLRRYQDRFLVNPGSAGMPYVWSEKAGRPELHYAILTVNHGAIQVEWRQVQYDADAAANAMLNAGMPHEAARALARQLRTGQKLAT